MASWRLCLALLGLSAAAGSSPCPPPCDCRPGAVACRGCPNNYLTLANATDLLYVRGCPDIQYLLRLHRPDRPTTGPGPGLTLRNVEIVDSFISKIPDDYLDNRYRIETLILKNNSISRIELGAKAEDLTLLDLSWNNISRLENGTFESMPKLLYLDLSANVISNVSLRCFAGLGQLLHLDLSVNNFTRLDDTVFLPLSSLQQLNLSSNRLQMLSERCFSSLLLLQQLDISYNRLTSVAPGTLQFLPNLARLLLADNPQLRPDAQIFVGTGRRLQQVDASRTGLSQVPEALTHSVRYLTLAGNRISTVRCGDLDSYPLLHMLDFTDNVIAFIEDDALGRLEMLAQLFLNKNRLRTIPKMLPDKLSYLSIDDNLIVNLTTADFATLAGLKHLTLANNLVSYIQENVFYQLVSLEVLDLSSNPIKVLTPNTFGGPASLKDLRIASVDISPPAEDISFPVPSPEGIEFLHLEFSPGLTRELMADTAALAAMTRLRLLDMRHSNITNIRSDLLHFLPQLKVLRLEGNKLNCSDLNWLADWMRENISNNYQDVKCSYPPSLKDTLVINLPTAVVKNATTFKIHKNVTSTVATILNSNETHEIHTNKIYSSFIGSGSSTRRDLNTTKGILKDIIHSNQSNFRKNNELTDGMTHQTIKANITDIGNNRSIIVNNTKLMSLYQVKNESIKGINAAIKTKKQIIDLEKLGKIYYNKDMTDRSKANITTPAKDIAAISSARKKLLEIFSDASQQAEDDQSNVTNAKKKVSPTTQESVSLCSAAGNSNGTENKTKCSQHPVSAPGPAQTGENKNTEPERFIYRKSENNKSNDNARTKKSKSVSSPDRSNATSAERNASRAQHDAKGLFSHRAQPLDLAILRNDGMYVHNFGETKSGNTIFKAVSSGQRINSPKVADAGVTTKATPVGMESKPAGDASATTETLPSTTDASAPKKAEESDGKRNASLYEMSGFRAEAAGGGADAWGALLVLAAAACLVLAGACLARRRPRKSARDVMEVPTIAAVGGLW